MMLAQRIARYKKSSSQAIRVAEQSLMDIEKEFTDNPSTSMADQLELQARVVNSLHFEKAERKIFYCKQKMYECGQRAGRLLAYLARMDHRPPTVVSLRDTKDILISDPDVVAGEFRSFFVSLYSSSTNNPKEEVETLLAGIDLPMLTRSQVELLEAPVTEDDIVEAMSHLNPSKAPG